MIIVLLTPGHIVGSALLQILEINLIALTHGNYPIDRFGSIYCFIVIFRKEEEWGTWVS